MAEDDQRDDNGVELFQEKDFKLLTSKKKKNKKSVTFVKTRPGSSKLNLTI